MDNDICWNWTRIDNSELEVNQYVLELNPKLKWFDHPFLLSPDQALQVPSLFICTDILQENLNSLFWFSVKLSNTNLFLIVKWYFSIELANDRTQSYVEKIDLAISTMGPQLIFVVLFKQVADKYAAVKKKSLVDRAGMYDCIHLLATKLVKLIGIFWCELPVKEFMFYYMIGSFCWEILDFLHKATLVYGMKS